MVQLDELLPGLKKKIFLVEAAILRPPAGASVMLEIPQKETTRGRPPLHERQLGRSKGVVLSHRNHDWERLAVARHARRNSAKTDPRFTAVFTALVPVPLWFPLIEGVRIITYPNRWRLRNARS